MSDVARWVLVTGAGLNLQPAERGAAMLLGSLLAREGYSLIAGTWGGVDEHVTRAFVSTLPTDQAASRVIHVENHDWRSYHDVRVGAVIKSSPQAGYSIEAISRAHAGMIVSGREGSKPAMDALTEIGKPVIPLAWLGNDAFQSLQDLLRDAGNMSRNHKRLLASLIDPACGSDETISHVLGSVLGSEHAIFISYHRTDSGADAGRLAAHLAGLYGNRRVFVDYESLPIAEHLNMLFTKASACRLMIAMIGPQFAARTANDNDYVRRELLAAARGGAIVLPVVVDREFAAIGQLSEALEFLGQRNAVQLRRSSWDESLRAIEMAANKALGITRMRDTRY